MDLLNHIINTQPHTLFWSAATFGAMITVIVLSRTMINNAEAYAYIRRQDLLEITSISLGICGVLLCILAFVLGYHVGLIPGGGLIIAAVVLIVTMFKNMDKQEELQNSVRLARKQKKDADPPKPSEDDRPIFLVPGVSSFRHPPLIDTASSPAASGYRAKRVDSGTQVRMDSDADTQKSRGKNSAQR